MSEKSMEMGIQKPKTLTEKIENYEKDADMRARKERKKGSLLEKMLGKGLTKEDQIAIDAQLEDEYRELEKSGVINHDELQLLLKNNLKLYSTGWVEDGGGQKIIRGTFDGSLIDIQYDLVNNPTYSGTINGKNIAEEAARASFINLRKELEKRQEIFEKIGKYFAGKIIDND